MCDKVHLTPEDIARHVPTATEVEYRECLERLAAYGVVEKAPCGGYTLTEAGYAAWKLRKFKVGGPI
jgi:Mn-dependent DtxR family transcriptional regulator